MRTVMVWVFGGACSATSGATEVLAKPEMATVEDAFWNHWGDGRAELSAYELTTPRYGQSRTGRVTLVFVTERFTEGQRVKSDGGHVDEYPVLKINEIRDFQTGIYDYNVMTSTFLRLDGQAPWGEPVKVSMSMQEWCGHVYEQVLPQDQALTWTQHSYFDGEADRTLDLGRTSEGVVADALPALVRGLVQPAVQPGETRTIPGLTTLVSGRLRHQTPSWTPLTITVAPTTHPAETKAGAFEVRDVVTTHAGATTTWWVEVAEPHRLVGWQSTSGETARLVGSERLPYWQMSGEGNERMLSRLGLPQPKFVD